MRGISFILVAAVFLAEAAPGGIVRSCVFPASECGELAPQAGGRLVLPSFDGGRVALTLGGRTESVTGHASFGGRADGAILRNATDVRFTLPLFGQKPASLFAVNEGVIGFWRHGDDGLSTCVLVNASLQHAYDVSVPMVDEGVCEVISGYGTPVAAASEIGDIPTVYFDADRAVHGPAKQQFGERAWFNAFGGEKA